MKLRLLIFFIILYTPQAIAQLQANFSIDQSSGCSPLVVQFTNNTTGASAAVNYKWDLGNANTSTLANPGASYTEERTYTIILTATDGANTSSVSKTVIVYKKPTVEFLASPLKGCVPVTINFSSKSTAGDGTIVSYLWDFGDGTTAQGIALSKTSHLYTVPQTPPVSLTVTNSFGCYNSVQENGMVEIYAKLTASFTASNSTLCSPGPVSFTNTSSGGGTLTYLWNFGDGNTSTEESPTHDFSSEGNFIIRLTVKNDAGCTAVAKALPVNVARFKADFAVPASTCTSQSLAFSNKSTRPYESIRWEINNAAVPYLSNGNMNYRFTTPGTYAVKLIAVYKQCPDTAIQTITVANPPVLNGFLIERDDLCNLPVRFTFTDTSSGVSQWVWRYEGNRTILDSAKTASHTYTVDGTDRIGLTVTNDEGCSSSIVKAISFYQTKAAIAIKTSTSPAPSPNRGCPGLKITFNTIPLNEVVSFSWNFGDGSISALPQPAHVYNSYGSYQVALDYVTKTGCAGRMTYDSIFVNPVLPSDFVSSEPDSLICGNAAVMFTPVVSLANVDYIWLIDGKRAFYSLTPDPFEYRFQKEGVYSISLVTKSGSCTDTVTKVNYITVTPPFPQIKSALNTCNGTRGLVVFTDTTRETQSWAWDFGDGGTANYSSFTPSIAHTYAGTGNYKVKLTATNGTCTVTDSVYVNVLLRQNPLLSSLVDKICTSDSPVLSLSGFEPSPRVDTLPDYQITKLQFDDLSTSKALLNPGNWSTGFQVPVYDLEAGKQQLRIITTSGYFGCADTSNFINMKVSGPEANLSLNKFSCFKEELTVHDLSTATPGSPIVKWEWLFGDTTVVASSGNPVSHFYQKPGDYLVALKVTDANGCARQTKADSAYLLSLTGPYADFEASAYDIFINTRVDFTNQSTYTDNTEYRWRFHDGSVSGDEDTYFFYDEAGDKSVRLIATNTVSGCTDTAFKIIQVKSVQSIFTYDITYVSTSNCPPAIIGVKSASLNAASVSWKFGDGGEAGDETIVTHVYTAAGIYKLIQYSYDGFGGVDSSMQEIVVKGPYATLSADTLFACNAIQVKLTAVPVNAVSFKWDFGDGNLEATTDTFAAHQYTTAGIYIPSLILTDATGCSAPSLLNNRIVVDSLFADIKVSPDALVCDSGYLTFTPNLKSFSETNLNSTLQYLWTSGMHQNSVTSKINNVWYYNKQGIDDVHLMVSSAYGCQVDIVKQVEVKQGVVAGIATLSAIACSGDSITFVGSAVPATGNLEWRWQVANTDFSTKQSPDAVVFPSGGVQAVALIVSNGFCSDTAHYSVNVFQSPLLNLTASKPYLCEGDTALLKASGNSGNNVSWSPAPAALFNGGYAAAVKPVTTTFYTAKVTDAIGCDTEDSIKMQVINPFKLHVQKTQDICFGVGMQLAASGADTYKWSGNGLTSTEQNPFIIPDISATYTVIGYDGYNCFSDTAQIVLTVKALPTVNLGPDQKVIAGFDTPLRPLYSADVVQWNWLPSTFLSCTNCAATVSKPEYNIDYTLTVTNSDGCIQKDTMRLEMLCGSDLMNIPTAFTPNGDNLNDKFVIHGSGVIIKKLAIFDRWGKVVFERKNISPFDLNAGWDGTYNGQLLATGGYIYMVEAICEKGEPFVFKGTVTLIR